MYFVAGLRIVEFGTHDVTLRRGADKIKRVAGHQRDAGTRGGREHRAIFGRDDGDLGDVVALRAPTVLEIQVHADGGVLELAEEAVAVRGDAEVAGLVERRGSRNADRKSVV